MSSINSTSPYRVLGPITPLPHKAQFKVPEALENELKALEQQQNIREQVNLQYAQQHQYTIGGQVLVNGKVFATVFESKGMSMGIEMQENLPLSDANMSTKARLQEIAQALQGKGKVEIRNSDFLPTMGGMYGPGAPESELPSLTVRSHEEIMHDIFEYLNLARMRSKDPEPTDPSSS